MCQLIKVGTMLFDGKNIDEHGRSQLFLSYIFFHKIIQNGFSLNIIIIILIFRQHL